MVNVEVNETDTTLRPSMTTSNRILTRVFEDTLFIPLESVRTNDSLTYVYTKDHKRKVVVLGESNENAVIVEKGLNEGDVIYLSTPSDPESFDFAGLNLIEDIRRKEAEKKAEMENQQEQPQQRMRGQRPGGQRPQRNSN
jgi:hypothetical protein